MPNPLGYYFYVREHLDGLLPAPHRGGPEHGRPDTFSRRQSMGMLLMCATICVPVIVACGIAFALKLLS
ncbi:MAG: hypothetical protein P4M09_29255 [Devosia sp.]|nr:hypothetical protein [Devosia sp.]